MAQGVMTHDALPVGGNGAVRASVSDQIFGQVVYAIHMYEMCFERILPSEILRQWFMKWN